MATGIFHLCYCLQKWLIFIGIMLFILLPVNAAESMKHIVQPGETLYDIAEMYGYTTQELSEFNQINPTQSLMLGEQINFPEMQAEQQAHEQDETEPDQPKQAPATPVEDKATKSTPYAYFGAGEPVAEVLKNFAGNYGLPVLISEKVTGVVNGKIGPLPSVAFLDELAQLNHLLWYFDGDTLYVYDGQEISKTIVNLKHLTTEALKKTLIDMGVWDSRYGWRERPREGIIYLSGPPRYIELVTETATLLDEKHQKKQKQEMVFKVFALKYAWAEDHVINYREQQIQIPGVARLLQDIVIKGGVENLAPANTPTRSKSITPATPITGEQPPKLSAQNPPVQNKEERQKGTADNVFINADRRSNSVIVHDYAEKMPMYESLLKTLDKPLSQIEINVSIIDVDIKNIEDLGVNWGAGSVTRKPSGAEFKFDPSGNDAATILKVAGKRLLASVKLLATKNRAKILSQPSVLTLDNMEAILDNSQTFYVKVAGGDNNNNTAQLYPITSGSVLKVTPRIIRELHEKKVHLDVNIQDGTSEEATNLGDDVKLPVVKNTAISTQAMIDEDESLLVGGYFYEKKSVGVKKIPLLGDLPLLGTLFRNKENEYIKNVRLFLITPKIVNLM